MNSGKEASAGRKKRGKSLVPPSSAITKAGARSEDRTVETIDEYVGGREGSGSAPLAPGPQTASGSKGNQLPATKEQLAQEWEIEEPSDNVLPSEDDIVKRLDHLEKRLDAFENTCYTFLLYSKQLADRTVSFYQDIFGLSQEDLSQIHDRLGINHNNRGNYPAAIEAFKKLVELNRAPASCYKLGVAYDNNGDFREAIEAYRSSISLDTAYLKAHYKLAEVYSKTENYGEAIRCLAQAVAVDSENAETHYRLGSIHSSRGSYDQAITAFNRVLELAPQYPGICQSLGLAYEQKGEHNKAIEFFKRSLSPSLEHTATHSTPDE